MLDSSLRMHLLQYFVANFFVVSALFCAQAEWVGFFSAVCEVGFSFAVLVSEALPFLLQAVFLETLAS